MPSSARIGFSLDGESIPLATFIEAARDLCAMLSDLEFAISGKHTLDWNIADLSTGSAHVAVAPMLTEAEGIDQSSEVIAAFLNGMEKIERAAERPPYFTDETLLRAKNMVGAINGRVERIALFGNPARRGTRSKRVRVTQRVAANVDQLVGTAGTALGSLEGTLETITIHGGIAFNIYDAITGQRVRCICERDILDQLTNPTHLGRRVLVYGEIRFNKQGQPVSVRVESFRFLKAADELPQVKDIRGLLAENPIDKDELSDSLRQ